MARIAKLCALTALHFTCGSHVAFGDITSCASYQGVSSLAGGCNILGSAWSFPKDAAFPYADAAAACDALEQRNPLFGAWHLPTEADLSAAKLQTLFAAMGPAVDRGFWYRRADSQPTVFVPSITDLRAPVSSTEQYGVMCVAEKLRQPNPVVDSWQDVTTSPDGEISSCKESPSRCMMQEVATQRSWTGVVSAGSSWDEASNLCETLSYNGLYGWRLPSVDELQTLRRSASDSGAWAKWLSFEEAANNYWTATRYDSQQNRIVFMFTGMAGHAPTGRTYDSEDSDTGYALRYHVICVQ